MIEFRRARDFSRDEILGAMKQGTLEMSLGPFTTLVKANSPSLLEFFYDAYRDVPVRLVMQDVTDITLEMRAPTIVRRYIRKQIIPDPGFQVPAIPLPESMAALSFEMGLNLAVALKCCRYVTFHAGVVAGPKGAILMCAASGGGKSTLVSALMEEGYRLYSDEFGLLNLQTAKLHAYPRPISLKGSSIPIVRDMSGPDWMTPALTGTPKGQIAYRRPRPEDILNENPVAVTRLIFFPRFQEGARPAARKMAKSEAIMRLIPSSTNYHLLGEEAFTALANMVAGAEAYELVYGNTRDSLVMVKDLAAKVMV
ncbi:HprK-related kinase A [Kordiimonas pumila]|uniref:HprK-related kinase A n=1 Tax=Kordiimonas pumila TaxID=2161677 RepID=A0ABV7D2N5_9PROT|nr:HprK-related kinase A [Kordiimonas pumila]